MTKLNFLLSLKEKLSGLPQDEIEERLRFYSEMIEDRVEEGLSEEDAVSAVGSVDEIAAQITADIPLPQKATVKLNSKRRMKAWEILLIVLGSPVWLALLIAACTVIFALWVSLWAVIVSLWAVFASFSCCAVAAIIAGIVFVSSGNTTTGIAMVGAGMVCAGLAILLFYGCHIATKATVGLTKKIPWGIKKCFVHKEEA